MNGLLEQLSRARLGVYRFEIIAVEPLNLPNYKGSTFRGAFGHAFKRVSCALRGKDCEQCLLRNKCVYCYVFLTPPPPGAGRMRKYPYAPHPFVLEPPPERYRFYRIGEKIRFGLVLVGKGNEYLPYFIYAFDEMGQVGIGRGKGRFRLLAVYRERADGSFERIYDGETKVLTQTDEASPLGALLTSDGCGGAVSVAFLTPTRLKGNGRFASQVDFQLFIRSLLRRASSLLYFHCGVELDVNYRELIRRAGDVRTVNSSLRWYDWERYSSRQGTRMKLGGLVGSVEFAGDIGEFMPLIKFGEIVHIGKGTSFGLGKYVISEKTT